MDAINRSIETMTLVAEQDKILPNDCLRYSNRNKICYLITKGKISPWMLYQSKSGVKFLESLDERVREAGGRVYPAKDARMSKESFKDYFPEKVEFEKYKDPKFSSSFWRRVT